jgi:hypothetical protein
MGQVLYQMKVDLMALLLIPSGRRTSISPHFTLGSLVLGGGFHQSSFFFSLID